jgi:hypothetical protein
MFRDIAVQALTQELLKLNMNSELDDNGGAAAATPAPRSSSTTRIPPLR